MFGRRVFAGSFLAGCRLRVQRLELHEPSCRDWVGVVGLSVVRGLAVGRGDV